MELDPLESVRRRLATLGTKVQRLQGRQAAAKEELARVEQECRARNIDPDGLDETILKLAKRYEESLIELETRTKDAEEKLARYTEDS